jgi:serine protease Do
MEMHMRTLLIAVVVSALAAPALQAQTPAAPEDRARVEMPRPGRVGTIGLRLTDVTSEHVKTFKLPKQEGAVVESVRPNSPAATAGFHEKDVVVQFDGERVRSASHLTRLVGETPAGREVVAAVMREGRRLDLRVKPEAGTSWFDPRFGGMIDLDAGEWREQMERAGRAAREIGRNFPEMVAPDRGRLGVTVQDVSGELAAYFGVKAGVLVSSVVPDSAAAKAGLRAGDVITEVNGTAVATPRELVAALPAADAPRDVTLTVFRDRKEMTLKATLAAPASSTSRRARGPRV